MSIKKIHNPWRDEYLPASFRGALFHCASNAFDGGERVVVHEFPKKDFPYTERMGRKAGEFTVRGYIVAYGGDYGNVLMRRDYRIARDQLRYVLDLGEEGQLQLPSLPVMNVICQRYRLSEEQRFGGYCTFDMSFVESGTSPLYYSQDTQAGIIEEADELRKQVLSNLTEEDLSPQEIQTLVAGVDAGTAAAVQKAWDDIILKRVDPNLQ
jgi:prophage DNA circulation protein